MQRRLAFDCPFTLRKVVKGGDKGIDLDKLVKVMNPKIKELKFNIGKGSINFDKVKIIPIRLFKLTITTTIEM